MKQGTKKHSIIHNSDRTFYMKHIGSGIYLENLRYSYNIFHIISEELKAVFLKGIHVPCWGHGEWKRMNEDRSLSVGGFRGMPADPLFTVPTLRVW